VFKGEVEETVVKVKIAVSNLTALKDVYEQYRKKMPEFFRHGESKEWEFAPVLVFHRYDKFIERVQLVYVRRLNAHFQLLIVILSVSTSSRRRRPITQLLVLAIQNVMKRIRIIAILQMFQFKCKK